MELSNQEGEIPIPLNSTYGHGHMIHHDHIMPSSTAPQILANGPSSLSMEDHVPYNKKAAVRYRECLKNHAASMGGNATDGCGEFMPSGEEGTIEALTCSACNCHRNFHRKEVEGGEVPFDIYPFSSRVNGRKLVLGHHKSILPPEALGYPTATGTFVHSRSAAGPTPHQMIMSYNMLPSESDEDGGGAGGGVGSRPLQLMKKRFRTKFSQEQKEKMLNFAEKVGWKIQKQEESVVQQFCQEIGVKRRVLKVWMHNNKHSLAKKDPSHPTTTVPAAVSDATTTLA